MGESSKNFIPTFLMNFQAFYGELRTTQIMHAEKYIFYTLKFGLFTLFQTYCDISNEGVPTPSRVRIPKMIARCKPLKISLCWSYCNGSLFHSKILFHNFTTNNFFHLCLSKTTKTNQIQQQILLADICIIAFRHNV